MQPNQRNHMGGARLLAAIPDAKAALVNLDPQYRAVLDHLKFGNEGKRQARRAALPQMTDDDIVHFLQEAERVLKPGRHVLLWVDKFILGEGRHLGWLRRTGLQRVDLIGWNKVRMGMGRRTRGVMEYLVVLQKPPVGCGAFWKDRGITDCWPESVDQSEHPHAKPIALMTRLVKTLTKPRELVVDPCAGGYGMLDVCRATNREFLGCDLAE